MLGLSVYVCIFLQINLLRVPMVSNSNIGKKVFCSFQGVGRNKVANIHSRNSVLSAIEVSPISVRSVFPLAFSSSISPPAFLELDNPRASRSVCRYSRSGSYTPLSWSGSFRTSRMATTSAVPLAVATDPTSLPLTDFKIAERTKVIVEESSRKPLGEIQSECLILLTDAPTGTDEDTPFTLPQTIAEFDRAHCRKWLHPLIAKHKFTAALGSSLWVQREIGESSQTVYLLGIGEREKIDPPAFARLGAEIADLLQKTKCKSVSLVLPHFSPRQVSIMLESMWVKLEPDNRFRSMKSKIEEELELDNLEIVVQNFEKAEKSVYTQSINNSKILAQSVNFAAQLVDAPANYCNTVSLANSAIELAKKVGLEARVLDLPEIERLGMGAYLAVAKGSMYPPKFIHLTYKPTGPSEKSIALVGKGLCFDAGGYNIKNAACNIELMKFDMGGAAAVLGAALAIGSLKPKNVTVHFIVAAAENMISHLAYRPGDIITASNGKTIEVFNTDAEGRLTLADALVYAEKLGVSQIVDIATLTGACLVGLGTMYAGVLSPSQTWAEKVLKSGGKSGELLWQLPLAKEYRKMLDSKVADINNIATSGKGGGTITAGLFLNEFVSKEVDWAHVDIAGPAWNFKEGKATGFGVRTLTQLVLDL